VGFRLGLGAEVLPAGVRFRVWAPRARRVDVVLESGEAPPSPLAPEGDGYFSGVVAEARAGTRYRYRLDGAEAYPDPCSRFQPEGPHGPSLVVDPSAYRWRDADWPGVSIAGQVIYELHVGTFTREGTFDAAARELPELRRLGVTLVEIMPVAEFPGRWNWGYDGVDLYAPSHVYGDPEALKRFVDAAHAAGVGAILDVVYNHLGPDGNYLPEYSPDYFTDRYPNEWGDPINFDGPNAGPVREHFIRNAAYWVAEFHLDGLRLDATQSIHDASPTHVLAELSTRAREVAAPRTIVLVGENEPQQVLALAPADKGGYGLDALWNDDFHHSARVALTGRREAYYTDYRGDPQELASCLKRGFLFQGQRCQWQGKPRGSVVTREPASAFIFYLQNHDQVANHLLGERIHGLTRPGQYRALATLMLLAPETPLLFMGQEFAASSPFLYFADHGEAALANSVRRGRAEFLAQFPSYGSPEGQARVPDPCDPSTFERCKLDLGERVRHAATYRFHRDLLQLRREDPVFAAQSREDLDAAVLGPGALVVRFFGPGGDDRMLLVNAGPDLLYDPAPEPLLAPLEGGRWQLMWSSDHPDYGGPGVVDPGAGGVWRLLAGTATVFRPAPAAG
jgi:maltooligosyltrehalose trehalohydrolase